MATKELSFEWLSGGIRALRLYAAQSPIIRKLYYSKVKRPALPNGIGMALYQARSSWILHPDSCPCDIHFVEYLKEFNIQGRSIFHFGTGEHHVVGLQNQMFDQPNEVLAITASAPEHQVYVRLVLENTGLSKYYKVFFADIYTLTSNTLPRFDVVTLFHLCEFYLPENAPLVHQTDESLLQLFLDQLNPGGKIFFYTGSQKWQLAQPIVQAFEAAGKIRQIGEYKSLVVYDKGDHELT
jgi:SAM-dependent methyltransferase